VANGKNEITAIEIKPDYTEAHFNLGTTYLLNRNFEEGWAEYEWRFLRKQVDCPKLPDFSQYIWDGSSLENKTIYVCYEQGYGDIIQFARFVPILNSMGAKVIFKVPAALEKLFKQNDLKAEIISSYYPDNSIKFDTFTYLMSLPYLLKLNFNNIPLTNGYLEADANKARLYKEKYFNNNKFKIGINWKGSQKGSKKKTVPFQYFCSIADIPDINLYSLQKEDKAGQDQNLFSEKGIVNLGKLFDDFSDTAAAIENLDLIISNDTSIVHLAGAMGKPTWVLLPFVPDWRWLLETETSLWYNNLKLIRQNEQGNWDSVFKRVQELLRDII
jgi:hypothetical protein